MSRNTRRLAPAGLRAIEAVARRHLELGWHSAAQLAVYRDGALQCDLRLGAVAPGRPMDEAARMLWFSTTKPLTAVCVLMLAERGHLDLDRPIAEVWPEFARGGKTRCTPRHVLTHQGGFPVFPHEFDWHRIDNWDAVTRATAALRAVWEPGTAVGYHPVTYGFALGELIRRVDGRMPRDFMREELFEPLDMQMSLGVEDEAALADVVPLEVKSEVTLEDPEGSERRTSDIVRRFSLPTTLRGQLPAANAIGTAEAMARFYAMLGRGGELGGVRILAPQTVAEATRIHVETAIDRTTLLPASYGLGFLVGGVWEPFSRAGVFGHSGQQSSIAYADLGLGIAVAYVTNGLHDPPTVHQRTAEVVAAVIAACDA